MKLALKFVEYFLESRKILLPGFGFQTASNYGNWVVTDILKEFISVRTQSVLCNNVPLVRVLDCQSKGLEFETTWCLQGRLNLLCFILSSPPGIRGKWFLCHQPGRGQLLNFKSQGGDTFRGGNDFRQSSRGDCFIMTNCWYFINKHMLYHNV